MRHDLYLGIEFGSTRIKAVLIDETHTPIASGSHPWASTFCNGFWTYPLSDVWEGLQACYRALQTDYAEKYNEPLTTISAIGVSAMMHGYLAFDAQDRLLVPFRTWQNTTTAQASKTLGEAFQVQIPQRWSIAHLYQAMQNGEPHVFDIAYLTTLAGYVHWQLTGERVLGVGDASGMFPLADDGSRYNPVLMDTFDNLAKPFSVPWRLASILPEIRFAGDGAGTLTAAGAARLDPSGKLKAGVPFCPPEGDAGTGMTATNSVRVGTGNISAGTSIFSMVVLKKSLATMQPNIDMVATPEGAPVAMVHCNNCCGDLDAWVRFFGTLLDAFGAHADDDTLYRTLFSAAQAGQTDCGGLLSFPLQTGEPILGLSQGVPMLLRPRDAQLSVSNFMRAQLDSALCTLRIGMDELMDAGVRLDTLTGHGGFFKSGTAAAAMTAAAMHTPITLRKTAGEGGPWGMAILASYRMRKEPQQTLTQYLDQSVFSAFDGVTIEPNACDAEGFETYLNRFRRYLNAERSAAEVQHA